MRFLHRFYTSVGKTDSSDVHVVFICDSHGCFYFPWGAQNEIVGGVELSEHSLNFFLQYYYLVCGLLEL